MRQIRTSEGVAFLPERAAEFHWLRLVAEHAVSEDDERDQLRGVAALADRELEMRERIALQAIAACGADAAVASAMMKAAWDFVQDDASEGRAAEAVRRVVEGALGALEALGGRE